MPTPFYLKRITAALTLGAYIAMPGALMAAGLPELGDSSDAVLSAPQERAIGKRIMLEVRGDRAFVEDAEIQDYISAIGTRLVGATRSATNDNRRDFEFFVLNDESINAFALLGGFIGIHSGLLLATANESELAGVLGHELAHILQRHQSRGADAQRKGLPIQLLGLATAILAARSGSSSSAQATEAALATSVALSTQRDLDYSRDFESEADRLGIQTMAGAGFDPRGMVGFFERLLSANRYNDGKTPGYLRSHPLTTERIADMQNRVDQMGAEAKRSVPDSADYRFAQAKLRVMSIGGGDAIGFFRDAISQRTVLRNRADVYGLALALNRTRDFANAEKELNNIRGGSNALNPWVEGLAAEIKAGQRKWAESLQIYRAAMLAFPQHRASFYGSVEVLYESGQTDAALAQLNERLKSIQDDPRLFELAAKGYEKQNKKLAQHRAIGEAYFRRGNLIGAVEQLQIAVKAKDGDFYEASSAESRLREMRVAFRNRPLMPGENSEKRGRDDDREDPPEPTRKSSRLTPLLSTPDAAARVSARAQDTPATTTQRSRAW
ncbi:MAG: M48 family metalloprotease [Burkholderiales bacterium]|nr:M48 family metalloprotease [Burkholderiales bacterium]